MVKKFVKKPIVVEADQFIYGSRHPDRLMFESAGTKNGLRLNSKYVGEVAYVITAQGEKVYVSSGEWIINETNSKDRAYPCDPDVFAATYDPVEEVGEK